MIHRSLSDDIRLLVSVDEQTLTVFRSGLAVRGYPVSTAEKGVGTEEGSLRTPTGNFRIRGKVGSGLPLGTVFRARRVVGRWTPGTGEAEDLILSRILPLEGVDAGNANTYMRRVYIHGTNREDLIGTPASQGCVRLRNDDMMELFDLVPEGAPLRILPPRRRRGKLFFVDCDSTLSTIEGIDELARARGEGVFEAVVAMTNAAMNGEIPVESAFGRRMDLIRPDAVACARVAEMYRRTVVPGMAELMAALRAEGWLPVILSGGFKPLIGPLADDLGVRHVEAVPLAILPDGSYGGYGEDYPTTRAGGKNEIIRDWRAAMLPERVVMMGDGASDLETKPEVDLFIGYGGVVEREKVRREAGLWLPSLPSVEVFLDMLGRASGG